MRVAETEDFDRVALSLLGEKGLAKPLFVFGDNGIGGGKNMSGGAEILLETDLEGIRKVAGEAADVSDVAPAPAIDRLVIVADDEETFMVGGKRFEPAILGEVDVLIFVGQEAIEPRGPEIPIVFIALQGERWPEQQIAKISRVSLTQTILIIGIDPRAGAKTMNVERFAGAFGGGDLGFDPSGSALRGDEIIFEFGDPVGHDLERIAAGLGFVPAAGEIERFHGSLEKAAAVVSIEDVKAGAQARDFRLVAKLAGGKTMVGAEPGWCLDAAEGRADAGRHLLRGLVGESDGENPGGRKAIGRDALNDRGRQGGRLAGAGTGKNQDRAGLCGGFGLGLG